MGRDQGGQDGAHIVLPRHIAEAGAEMGEIHRDLALLHIKLRRDRRPRSGIALPFGRPSAAGPIPLAGAVILVYHPPLKYRDILRSLRAALAQECLPGQKLLLVPGHIHLPEE